MAGAAANGPVLNTAVVALSAFGNVPTERAAHLVGMLYGQQVSAGFADRAGARLAERLTWLTGLDSRRHDSVIAALRTFVGHLIVDGYAAYQKLLAAVGGLLAGLQQCCQHVFRRARGVGEFGPGSLQASWTREIRQTLTAAHDAVQAAKARGRTALDPDLLARLRARFDHAAQPRNGGLPTGS